VTAANASGINDGAAATVLMSGGGRKARHQAAWPGSPPGPRRRRPGDHGHRPDPGVAQGAGKGRLEGRRPRPGGSQRGLRRPGLRGQQGHGLGPRHRERQRRRHRHRPPDRRLGARGFSTRCCSRCSAATPRRASPRCASAAAWALPCASSATDPHNRKAAQFPGRREPAPPRPGRTTTSDLRRRNIHGTSSTGHRRVARDRRSHFKALKAAGYTVAATYAGNDEKAAPSPPRPASRPTSGTSPTTMPPRPASPRSRPILARSRSWSPMPASPATRCSTR
jgi:hypothetical protein